MKKQKKRLYSRSDNEGFTSTDSMNRGGCGFSYVESSGRDGNYQVQSLLSSLKSQLVVLGLFQNDMMSDGSIPFIGLLGMH